MRGFPGRRWGGWIASTIFVIGCLVVCGVFPQPAVAGYASIVIDEHSGNVLTEVNADAINHPASLTKMMTLYLAFEALRKGTLHWDQNLSVSSWAANKEPTKLGLEPGDTISVKDCVLGMIVLSANDAATIVGEALGGSEDGFATLMTEKAHALGMTNTNFVNASGLPAEEQVTTARDLAKLAIALHTNFPEDYHYFSTRQFLFRGRLIVGHNRLMYRYPGMDGLKTGFTQASGFNLASSAERDGQRLVGIVMGGRSAGVRDRLMATLLDNGFAGRQTDPVLVAEAGGGRPRATHLLAGAARVIASLSPVSRAEAAVPPRGAGTVRPAATVQRGGVEPAVANWSIQLGTFSRENEAKEAAEHAEHLTGIAGHPSSIVTPASGRHIYRARLDDFKSSKQARAACDSLHRKGEVCAVLPPGHQGMELATTHS